MIRRFAKYWFPVAVYAAIIFYYSSLPRPFGEIFLFVHADKIGHFLEFAFLALLLRRALLNASTSYFQNHAIIWTFILGLMYGLSDEFHQSFVPGREPAALDLLFDTFGIFVSLWIKIK